MDRNPAIDLPAVGDGTGLDRDPRVHPEELALAFRNRAMPLEALRYDITPVGLHYVLVHYDIPLGDASSWTLTIDGAVARPFALSLAELQRLPHSTLHSTLECAGDGRALLQPRPISQPWQYGAVGTAEWTGTPLRLLLEEAGLASDVQELVFEGADRGIEGGVEQDYARSLPLADALRDDTLLVWEMNGRPLEPQNGHPLRLIVPGWYGMAHVKWLRRVTAVSTAFEGYQQSTAYRYSETRDDPGKPVELMRVRSLMEPPGIPDFLTRTRIVRRGAVQLSGRAWSGRQTIARVQVSTDAGNTWADARLMPASDQPSAWQAWSFRWDVSSPGHYELLCLATDSAGNVQPIEQVWTARGMGNNMAHRVHVQVI